MLLAGRWRRASAAQRRAVAPVLRAGGATLLALTASVVNDMAAKPLGQVPKQVLWAAVAALPVAVVVVLLEGRPPSAADLPALRHAAMASKEAMRLYPPAYAIGRRAEAETESAAT